MSITSEQLTYRRGILALLAIAGYSEEQQQQIRTLLGTVPPVMPQKVNAPLRYGDGCISPTLPTWQAVLGEQPSEII